MKDQWYADPRDLVKWGALVHLADRYAADEIVQVAYYRPSDWRDLDIDGERVAISKTVLELFRDIRRVEQLKTRATVKVIDWPFDDRERYHAQLLQYLSQSETLRRIVFLDPDTGLEPARTPGPQHVLKSEIRDIWGHLRAGDLLVLYQHQTNRSGTPWVDKKQSQFAKALGLNPVHVRVARSDAIARDVVLIYADRASE